MILYLDSSDLIKLFLEENGSERVDGNLSSADEVASSMLTYAFVGSPETVRTGLQRFIEQTGVDELIVAAAIYDHSARLRSYELLAELLPT